MVSLPSIPWGCTGSLDIPGYMETKFSTSSQGGGSPQKFIGPEPSVLVSRQNINNKIKCWLEEQHLAQWHSPRSTQRQARELILGPSPATRA